jgi:hypothetical protein
MGTPGKLAALAKEKGKPLERIIPPLVNQLGVVEAARTLKMSSATISEWLKDNGYIGNMVWAKKIAAQERADIDAAAGRVNARRIEQGLPTLEEEAEEEYS